MGEYVSNSVDGLLVSLTTLAREFGISRDTVGRRLREAGVRSTAERAGHPVFGLAPAARALVMAERVAVSPSSTDPERMTPQDRKSWYQSEKDRIAVERELKAVVSMEDCRLELALVTKSTVMMLETLPDILERDCGLGADALLILDGAIRNVREEWSEDMAR